MKMNGTVLITGASSGIGLAFCNEYAKQGYHIILVSRAKDKLIDISKNLENEYKIKTSVFAKDLTECNAVMELFKEIEHQDLSVDILINNAGVHNSGQFSIIPFDQIQKAISLNMIALTELSYLFLNKMVKKRKGIIINIASIASFFPTPYEAVYGATKAYVLSLTESLNYEYRKTGIKIIAVCPGVTKTNLYEGRQVNLNGTREPEQVVASTQNALKKGKTYVIDGYQNILQGIFPRLFTRKFVLKTTGGIGEKTWR